MVMCAGGVLVLPLAACSRLFFILWLLMSERQRWFGWSLDILGLTRTLTPNRVITITPDIGVKKKKKKTRALLTLTLMLIGILVVCSVSVFVGTGYRFLAGTISDTHMII